MTDQTLAHKELLNRYNSLRAAYDKQLLLDKWKDKQFASFVEQIASLKKRIKALDFKGK